MAILLAPRSLFKVLRLPVDRLWVSVLEGDRKTADLWLSMGVPKERVFECGPSDNFWQMGGTVDTTISCHILMDRHWPMWSMHRDFLG